MPSNTNTLKIYVNKKSVGLVLPSARSSNEHCNKIVASSTDSLKMAVAHRKLALPDRKLWATGQFILDRGLTSAVVARIMDDHSCHHESRAHLVST